jgi:HSP20 family protein
MAVKKKHEQENWFQAGTVARRVLGSGWGGVRHLHKWEPPTDVYENDDGLVVQMEIAGMEISDFSISLGDGVLVIEGIREDPEPKRVYYQMEIRVGPFRAEVNIPWNVDADRVEATYEQGMLRVFLPRPPVHRVPIDP